MVRVKIQLGLADNADKFVWRHPDDSKYLHLIDFVTGTFRGISESEFQIQYRDDEGDLVTCSSESDINDALSFAEEEGLKSLKLFVITDVEVEMENEESENDDDVQVIGMDDLDEDDDRGMLDQREHIPTVNAEEEEDDIEDEVEHEDESPLGLLMMSVVQTTTITTNCMNGTKYLVHSEEHDDEDEEEEEMDTFNPDDVEPEEEEEHEVEVPDEKEEVQHQEVVAPVVVQRQEVESVPSMYVQISCQPSTSHLLSLCENAVFCL